MTTLSSFCTCTDLECPLHPTKHEKGCAPCIAKNLKSKEIPTCFFNLADAEHKRKDYTFESFAKYVLSE